MKHEHVSALARAIREAHGVEPVFRFVTHVTEPRDEHRTWSGTVYVFDLQGHPTARRCYGVVCATESGASGCVSILGDGPIDSAQAAVRAHLAHKRQA
jgi:hypothetical protein